MLTVALASVTLGYLHERFHETDDDQRHIRFGHVYLITGLLYVNLSL